MTMIPSENGNPLPSFSNDLTNWQKLIVIARSILRTLLGIIFIAVMLAFVPAGVDGAIWIPLGGIILVLVVYVWYFRLQLRRIRKSKYPNIQAGEALILVATMFLAIFAIAYDLMSQANPGSFTEVLDRFSAFYFAVTVLATVGFGDITPVTTAARSVAMLQMAIDIAFIAVAVKIVSGAASSAIQQRHPQSGATDE
jgi:voltage-gated potassium channel